MTHIFSETIRDQKVVQKVCVIRVFFLFIIKDKKGSGDWISRSQWDRRWEYTLIQHWASIQPEIRRALCSGLMEIQSRAGSSLWAVMNGQILAYIREQHFSVCTGIPAVKLWTNTLQHWEDSSPVVLLLFSQHFSSLQPCVAHVMAFVLFLINTRLFGHFMVNQHNQEDTSEVVNGLDVHIKYT